jgi:hypothetical protein
MTPGYTLHVGNEQPHETIGKCVKYRFFESERFGVFIADEINWNTEGEDAPSEHGRIFEYQVIT